MLKSRAIIGCKHYNTLEHFKKKASAVNRHIINVFFSKKSKVFKYTFNPFQFYFIVFKLSYLLRQAIYRPCLRALWSSPVPAEDVAKWEIGKVPTQMSSWTQNYPGPMQRTPWRDSWIKRVAEIARRRNKVIKSGKVKNREGMSSSVLPKNARSRLGASLLWQKCWGTRPRFGILWEARTIYSVQWTKVAIAMYCGMSGIIR